MGREGSPERCIMTTHEPIERERRFNTPTPPGTPQDRRQGTPALVVAENGLDCVVCAFLQGPLERWLSKKLPSPGMVSPHYDPFYRFQHTEPAKHLGAVLSDTRWYKTRIMWYLMQADPLQAIA